MLITDKIIMTYVSHNQQILGPLLINLKHTLQNRRKGFVPETLKA